MYSLEDLGIAYRKAKVDLYYSSVVSVEAIADYESELHGNLINLRDKINGLDEGWIESPSFIGRWTLVAKSVDMKGCSEKLKESGLVFASPLEEWSCICKLLKDKKDIEKPKAEFRVMAMCSLDFHVLSTLWMLNVGCLFDAKLSKNAYGNRLRRTRDGQQINLLSMGTFVPYMQPFKNWRDNGIKTMMTAIKNGKKIVAITADISSFYHKLNSGFMLNPLFINEFLRLELTDEQAKLHRLFIQAIQAWAASTPLRNGLPVGLPASAIIANSALIEFDSLIKQHVVPLYYGRYVDDILLVMEDGVGFGTSADVWEWLFARFDEKLGWVNKDDKKNISFHPKYLSDVESQSEILFSNSKNKVFILAGESGEALIEAIAHQIQERASEWRSMPKLPRTPAYVGAGLLAAVQSDGEAADNLRKADSLTMRRADFAIKLRDFEAYERDLHPDAWRSHRRAFFRAFVQHVLVLPQYFDLEIYLPRIIRLATACEDFDDLCRIVKAINCLFVQVEENCEVNIKACLENDSLSNSDVLHTWEDHVYQNISESIAAAFPPRLSKDGVLLWQKCMSSELLSDININADHKHMASRQARLFSFDLAHMPFRFIGLPAELIAQRGIPSRGTILMCGDASHFMPQCVLDGVDHLVSWVKLKGRPYGLLFATRPFALSELFVLNQNSFVAEKQTAIEKVVQAVRGFNIKGKIPLFNKASVLQVSSKFPSSKFCVAVCSWKTEMESWLAAVTRMPDPDADRYARLNSLLDGVISQPLRSRYLILPELSLPAQWFFRIARKLQVRGISLIAGVEYIHEKRRRVNNQIWLALSHDGFGFPSAIIYRQDKQRPALHEETELKRVACLELKPKNTWKTPPIVKHGNFYFSVLICSELTNIGYRSDLRGKVDALFILEWNQDTESFNAIVESAALDMHAYIIQCNDRQYGDSRIRAPFKDVWKRDVLRVKGGVVDYCVVGEIDIHELRKFQSSYRSASKPFKPVPDGFAISYDRKVLPGSEAD